MAEPKEPLTERELEVLKLLATGVSNKEIAAQLFLSPNTIKVHLRNIFTKLEVQTRTEATILAVRNGWISMSQVSTDDPALIITPSAGTTIFEPTAAPPLPVASDEWQTEAIPATRPTQESAAGMNISPSVAVPNIAEDVTDQTQRIPVPVTPVSITPVSITPVSITPVPVAPNPQLLPSLSLRRRLALVGAGLFTLLLMTLVLRPQPTDAIAPEEVPIAGRQFVVNAPDSTRWVSRLAVRTARAGSVGVAIDNTVLVVGGQTATGLSGEVLQYTPKQNTWVLIDAPKPTPVIYAGGAAIGNQIYVLGGIGSSGQPSRQFEVFDLSNRQWTALSNLPGTLTGHSVVANGGKLYVFGGRDNGEITNRVRVFDPATEQWSDLPSMSTARTQAAAAFLNDRIFVVGGYDGQQDLSTCEAYLLKENSWEGCPRMTTARSSFGLAAVGQVLYAVGGGFKDFIGFNEKYDFGQKSWSNLELPNTHIGDWRNITVVALPTEFYVIGGSTRGVILADNDVYEVFTVQIALPALQK